MVLGQLFPDNDPKWKGASSDVFIREAVRVKYAFFVVDVEHITPFLTCCIF